MSTDPFKGRPRMSAAALDDRMIQRVDRIGQILDSPKFRNARIVIFADTDHDFEGYREGMASSTPSLGDRKFNYLMMEANAERQDFITQYMAIKNPAQAEAFLIARKVETQSHIYTINYTDEELDIFRAAKASNMKMVFMDKRKDKPARRGETPLPGQPSFDEYEYMKYVEREFKTSIVQYSDGTVKETSQLDELRTRTEGGRSRPGDASRLAGLKQEMQKHGLTGDPFHAYASIRTKFEAVRAEANKTWSDQARAILAADPNARIGMFCGGGHVDRKCPATGRHLGNLDEQCAEFASTAVIYMKRAEQAAGKTREQIHFMAYGGLQQPDAVLLVDTKEARDFYRKEMHRVESAKPAQVERRPEKKAEDVPPPVHRLVRKEEPEHKEEWVSLTPPPLRIHREEPMRLTTTPPPRRTEPLAFRPPVSFWVPQPVSYQPPAPPTPPAPFSGGAKEWFGNLLKSLFTAIASLFSGANKGNATPPAAPANKGSTGYVSIFSRTTELRASLNETPVRVEGIRLAATRKDADAIILPEGGGSPGPQDKPRRI